jgi:hypothetical protein
MDSARHSSLGVSLLSSFDTVHNANQYTRCAECVSGFLVVCFPEMSFLINRKSRKRNYPRRPTNSMLEASTEAAQSRSRSRKMASNRDDLTYYELDDDLVYGVRVSPSASNSRLHEPANGTVQVHHEITIESTKKEDFVR